MADIQLASNGTRRNRLGASACSSARASSVRPWTTSTHAYAER
jgi:hypothetical protein